MTNHEEGHPLEGEFGLYPKLETVEGELGFCFMGTFITDPTKSDCGRFEVDPQAYYGLSKAQITQINNTNQGE